MNINDPVIIEDAMTVIEHGVESEVVRIKRGTIKSFIRRERRIYRTSNTDRTIVVVEIDGFEEAVPINKVILCEEQGSES